MWQEAVFKGKKVWVEVDSEGAPIVQGGRSPIRYSRAENARVYRCAAGSVSVAAGSVAEELPSGAPQAGGRTRARSSGLGKAGSRSAAQTAAAQVQAQDLIASFADNAVVCFTDGSCRGNPGPAGLGVLVKLPNGQELTDSQFLGTGTNNIAELSAAIRAIEISLDPANGVSAAQPIEVLTDSRYTVGIAHQNWKAKANRELCLRLRELLASRSGIRVHWVAGHAGIEGNERVDQLANQAIDNGQGG